MTVFEVTDYKKFLKFKVEETRGNLTKLAAIAQCQGSYLLRIINEEAHLTPDQAFRVCDYWNLDSAEKKYFMTLLNYERAADPKFKTELKNELTELIAQTNNLKKVVKRESADEIQFLLEYHSDFKIALTHFLTGCEKLQSHSALMKRLSLDSQTVSVVTDFLKRNALVSTKGQHIEFLSGAGHIPTGSPVLPIFLNNWRQLAIQNSLKQKSNAIHYTNLQTIGVGDMQKLLEIAKQFINKAKTLCDESAEEDVVVVNLDVFVP